MKKSLLVLSGVLAISTALAGCGNKSETPAATDSGSAAGGTKAPVTIKVQAWYTEAQGNWNATVDAYNKTHPNVKVVYESMSEKGDSQEGMKKLDLLAASGEQMDVVMYSSASDFAQRVGAGILEPLDDYLKKDNIVVKDEYKLDPVVNGKYYALPGKMIEWFVLLNKDKLDEAKLPVPTEWTWDQYAEYAKKMTKGEGASKAYGSYFHNWKDYALLGLNNDMENPYLVKSDGTQNIDNPKVRYSLDLRNKMENVDKTSVPYFEVVSQKMAYRDVFYAGKTAMLATGNWMVGELAQNAKFKTVFAPYPKYDAKDANGLTEVGADFMGVAANSKNKQAAYDFVKWYTTEGIQTQGLFFSGWKKADVEKNVDAILKSGKPEQVAMIDKESLLATLKVNKATKLVVPPTYALQQEKEYLTQVELFLTGKQDLEKTIQTAKTKIEDIRKSNAK
ncbi:ABC transporter substrate-binding protein [Paenibacillus aceris]|uniref:Multiple sugar transport system substrate-binding protein n=1 Tax=Paenibacillus aceris TaxID=869555 RepID=A0ABS4I4N3_9BACL|nr:extracellular solute-binding protein [Paenibacillus aceris]MBP1965882.1 multiple sugar transport system substrate-binding protein [Paenibacillus aceris]NHW35117.1 extracellular solute-binding protein [Paenibacillus aceris]